jgi:chitin deacetylase
MMQRNFNIDGKRVALASFGLLALSAALIGARRWNTQNNSSMPVHRATVAKPITLKKVTAKPVAARAVSHITSKQRAAQLDRSAPTNSIPQWARGRIVRQVPVQRGEKVIALTFDDGPWPRYTKEVLKVLASRNVKATFFMIGQEVQRRPDLVREVHAAGHVVGNHSWDHARKPRNPADEVSRTDAAINKAIGVESTLFRPPYGAMKNGMATQAMRKGQCVVIWSADSSDWKHSTADGIAQRILRQSSPGGIALLHDGGGNRGSTVSALPRIIDTLRKRGYRFVTVPELLALRHGEAKKPHEKRRSTKPSGKTLRAAASHSRLANR